ncbi:MAG TPA: diacylglycerol kinase family protein [Candidatus Dormibacteraeota bacterium]|nr:diacylglycerol kinase family protein [Candidatus Dormibacteraeota bacterium]
MSSKAGSMTPEIEAKLRKAFADCLVLEFDPTEDFEKLITPTARVVVAGGDGTIGFVVRKLADSNHPVGLISMGTYNNFAAALKLPKSIDSAIEVARDGTARAITLGRVNGTVFLEAAAIGLFGETIAAGDSAKERMYGDLAHDMKHVLEARPFEYKLSGDIVGSGSCMSLVFTNTSSIGTQMPISDSTPLNPYLQLSVHAGKSRTDILRRMLASAVLWRHQESGKGQVFHFRKLQVTTKPKVRIYADNVQVGRTPASLTAEISALKVLLSH